METSTKPLVCIVGAGVGGIITALELLKTGRFRVMLLDVDGLGQSATGKESSLLEYRSTGQDFNQSVIRGIGFGGGSNVWHGVVSELDDEDWGRIDAQCGHKVSAEVKDSCKGLDDYFGDLHCLFRDHAGKAGPESGTFYAMINDSGLFRRKDFFIQLSPLRCRRLLSDMLGKNSDLSVIEYGVAVAFTPDSSNPRQVEGVVVNQGGVRSFIKADIFVLAAGAIESPRILLQSKRDFGLLPESRLIGRYLTDHPWTVIGMIQARAGSLKMRYSDVRATRLFRYRAGYRLAPDAVNEEGLNSCISFKPLFLGEYEQFKEALKALITSRFSPMAFFRLLRQHSIKSLAGSAMTLIAEKFALGVSVKRCMVFCYLEQAAYEDSQVILSGEKDAAERDIPRVHWKVGSAELDSASRFQEYLSRAFADTRGPEFQPHPVTTDDITTGAHLAGTLRMGAGPSNGVIDQNLRVFGLGNLFVADLSLFPRFGNANPTYTLCGFARRLALHIRDCHAG